MGKKSKAKEFKFVDIEEVEFDRIEVRIKGRQGRMHAFYGVTPEGEEKFLFSAMTQDQAALLNDIISGAYADTLIIDGGSDAAS